MKRKPSPAFFPFQIYLPIPSVPARRGFSKKKFRWEKNRQKTITTYRDNWGIPQCLWKQQMLMAVFGFNVWPNVRMILRGSEMKLSIEKSRKIGGSKR
jgi:hypothetical protein